MATDTQLAFRVARALAKRWGFDRPLEYVGAAWEGINKARLAGVPDRQLPTVAARAVIDSLRKELGRRGGARDRMRRHTISLETPAPETDSDALGIATLGMILAVRAEHPGVCPVLSLWCETRNARARLRMTWRQRVRMALWLIEGMTFEEIAEVLGCSASAISLDLQTATKTIPGACAAFMAFRDTRRGERMRVSYPFPHKGT